MQPPVLIAVVLLFSYLVLYASAQSGQLGNAAEDAEEDRPIGCYALEPEEGTVNKLETANSSAALLRAQCYSVCLEEARLGTDKLSLMQEPHVTMTEYRRNYSIYNQVEECVRGCLIMDRVASSSLCQGECDQNQYCEKGCLALKSTNNSFQVSPVQPFIRPSLQLLESSPYNVTYTVNISGTDLFRVHNTTSTGSGNLTSGASSPVTFIFQIKANDTSHYYIVQPGLPDTITFFHKHICEEVEVRYALVNRHGISGYSPPYNLYIQGEIAGPPEPVDLVTVDIQSMYDYRRGYFGHARLNITWENPANITYISHYTLEMVGSANCGLANYTRIEPSAEVTTTHQVVLAALPQNAPYLGCLYQMRIQSVSVSDDFPSASTVWHRSIKSTVYNPDITFQCVRRLENDKFAIYTTVNISQYLAYEHVVVKIVLFPVRVEYPNPSKTGVPKRDHLLLQDESVEANQSIIVNVIPNLIPVSTSNVDYEVSMHTTWRDHLVYTPHVFTASCRVDGQGSKPAPVTNVQLIDQFQRLDLAKYRVAIHWTPPIETNGQLGHYNVCIGTAPLEPTDPLPSLQCSPTGDCYACTPVDPTAFNMTWDVFQLFPSDPKILYLQIRSNNIYRYGNWSDSMALSLLVSSTPLPTLTSSHSPTKTLSLSTSTVKPSTSVSEPDHITGISIGVSLGLCIPLAVMAALCILCIHWKLRQRKRQIEFIQETTDDPVFRMGPRKTNPLFEVPSLSTDDWEIPAAYVVIDESLGEGAFGEVYKGVITESLSNPKVRALMNQSYSSYVAVKLLKSSATGNERTDFISEIEMMKRITEGNNPHVVNMIGCVTIQEPLCLITEFVKYGDLQSYLRTNRKRASKQEDDSTAEDTPYSDLGELTSVDLISFAYQIASGMEFVASLGVVHRDLAARNILVGEGKSLKISDFGMARDVGTGADDVYVKTTRGRLPLKWMAIESIVDREFTTASDVWAYGVTLWEIGTLGGFPYPTVPNDILVPKLKQGYRMEKPDNCSPEIYDIMLECWLESARKRPTFTQLRAKFDSLLTAQQCCNPYIDLRTDEHKDYYKVESMDEDIKMSGKKEEIEENEEEEEEESMINERTSLHTPERRSCKSPDPARLRKSPSPSYLRVPLSPAAGLGRANHSPTRLKRSPSPSKSTSSGNCQDMDHLRLQVSNPWISEGDVGYTTLTPAHSFQHSPRLTRPSRPTSVALLQTDGRQNEYVEEPSLNPTLIQIVPSTPTPMSEPTDCLLGGLPSSPR